MTREFEGMTTDFYEECNDLLKVMENSLLNIQESGFNEDDVNSLFRAVHTIKGSAGIFEIHDLVNFTHIVENFLDKLRNKEITLSSKKIDLLLKVKDYIENAVEFVVQNSHDNFPKDYIVTKEHLTQKVQEQLTQKNEKIAPKKTKKHKKIENTKNILSVYIEILNNDDIVDADEIILFFKDNGKIENLNKKEKTIEFIFKSFLDEKSIKDSLSIIKDNILLKIQKVQTDEKKIDENKIKKPQQNKDIAKNQIHKTSMSLRVDSAKIDTLINQIGEMVITNAALEQKIEETDNKNLLEIALDATNMLNELRELSMKIRMVPIKETFLRFKRIVRDISKELNKEVELELFGEESEIDKSIAEKLIDPLIHLVRNALDHGIELPEIRKQQNKPTTGHLKLGAFHDSGNIIIQISDDGFGIDPQKIYQKAIEKGIITNDANLNKQQILNLIFEPGFSTASHITNLSGRGVGMDVVRKSIENLRGAIDINSVINKGTTITIKLPLTLAIIDGFLFKLSNGYYIIPLEMVLECIDNSTLIQKELKVSNYINLRGNMLPVLNLTQYFNLDTELEKHNIIVVKEGDKKMGFLVDEVIGKMQTVIKPIGDIFQNIYEISGATILGNGEVALIVNVPAILNRM